LLPVCRARVGSAVAVLVAACVGLVPIWASLPALVVAPRSPVGLMRAAAPLPWAAPPVAAQGVEDATPPDVGEQGQPAQGGGGAGNPLDRLGDQLRDALRGVLTETLPRVLDAWAENSLPQLLAKLFWALFGAVVASVRGMTGDLWERANFVTQLPLPLTVEHPWVRSGIATTTALAYAFLAVVLALHLLSAAARAVWDQTFEDVLSTVPLYVVVVGAALRFYDDVAAWAIVVFNALAARLLDPATVLPNWQSMSDLDRLAGQGLFVFVYWVAAAFLLLGRAITLLGVRLLLVAGPLMIVAAALPLGLARHWGGWWLGALVARVAVQVFQAFALGAGASILGSAGAALDAVFGIASLWLAVVLPGMLPGCAASPGRRVGQRLLLFAGGVAAGGPVGNATAATSAYAGGLAGRLSRRTRRPRMRPRQQPGAVGRAAGAARWASGAPHRTRALETRGCES
jgi:hypothetical protein